VTTEITVLKNLQEPTRAWALYDVECPICIELARWGRGPLKRRGVEFAHLQPPWVVDRLGISKDDPLRELIVIPNSGALLGGGDAIVYLIRRIWWAWPLWIAARRHCLTGTCSAPRAASADKPHAQERALDWLPLFALTGLIIALRPATSPWAFMWALASALFLGFKWLTWIRARREFGDPGPLRSLGYTATNIVFASLPFTYGWAALRGVMP
jgi:predicted DCC family thiol-disulfide oxidoreductase YuxK